MAETVEFLEDSATILDGLRLGEVGVWRWKVGTDELQWTRNLEQVHDLPAGSFTGTLSDFRSGIHPEDAGEVWGRIEASLETGAPYRTVYRTAPRPGREPLWIETCGGLVTAPDGARYLTGTCLDVSARVRSDMELKRRLRQQEAIERLGSFALAEEDFASTLQRATETAAEVLGAPVAKILQLSDNADRLILAAGVGCKEGLVGSAAVGIGQSQAGYTLVANGPVVVTDFATETRFGGPAPLHDHPVRSGASVVIAGSEKRPFGVFCVHASEVRNFDQADVEFLLSVANIVANAARHRLADSQRRLLVREMAHRAGNLLQLVVSIANQTFSAGEDIEAARRSFNDRLASLSRANHLVAQGGWGSTRFISLLDETLQPFRERFALQGRDVMLPPELCFDLALVLHELATNSVKYGALGKADGKVDLGWDVSGAGERTVFSFVWSDPSSTAYANPARTGFGSKLLRALIERKWGGSMTAESGAGYRFSLQIPVPV